MALKNTIDQIRTVCEAVDGLNSPPSDAASLEDPTSSGAYPFVAVYVGDSRELRSGSDGWGYALTQIIIEIHTAPRTRRFAHLETVENDLMVDVTFNDTCQGVSGEPAINWSFGELEHATSPTWGWDGRITVKHQLTFS